MENKITIEAIANEIRTRRPDLEVSVNEVIKNKQTLQGLTLRTEGVQIAPNIYVQQYIEEFQDLGAIADAILNTYEEHKCLNGFNVSDILNKQFILDHVTLLMQQQSEEPLIKMPNVSERFAGAEAYVAIVSQADAESSFSIKLNPQILQTAGIDIEKDHLFERALDNLREQVVISSMFDTLKEMMGVIPECNEQMPFPDNMYVITTKSKCKGASAILCDDILKDFADKHGISEFFIIPSSISECILVFGNNLNIDELSDMVVSVNQTQLEPIDILANQAWKYTVA